jgi:methylase of polypeptide subunit release factors
MRKVKIPGLGLSAFTFLFLLGCSGGAPKISSSDSDQTTLESVTAPKPENKAEPENASSEAKAAETDKEQVVALEDRYPDVVFVPTPQKVVERMLQMAKLKKKDVLYDLGCGDGRIVITAAQRYGVKAWGFDIDPDRVAQAQANVRAAKVEHLVTIEHRDFFDLDLSLASVVTLYLLPELNVRLIPHFEKMKPGSRIVSHEFDIRGVLPKAHQSMRVEESDSQHDIFLWQTPLKRGPDVIYVPTPEKVVDRMLQMAEVKKGDVLYDLGCGDGRIVITAAKRYGVKAWGFDIDPVRVAQARANVRAAKVGHLVTIEQKDVFELDLSPANVVTLYLLPELNVRLIPQLEKLKPDSRVVSHDFDMKGVTPETHEFMQVEKDEHEIFLWRVPLNKEATPPASGSRM